jgi:hypothetical protein
VNTNDKVGTQVVEFLRRAPGINVIGTVLVEILHPGTNRDVVGWQLVPCLRLMQERLWRRPAASASAGVRAARAREADTVHMFYCQPGQVPDGAASNAPRRRNGDPNHELIHTISTPLQDRSTAPARLSTLGAQIVHRHTM